MPYLNRTIYMPMELLVAFSKHTGLFWSGVEIEGGHLRRQRECSGAGCMNSKL